MVINVIKFGLLITVTQILFSASCNKEKTNPCSGGAVYNFYVNTEWSPQREIYNIGDTLFLFSTFPKTLLDNIGNQYLDYSNSMGIAGAAAFYELDSISHQASGATLKFDFYSEIGIIENHVNIPSQNKSLLYAEQPSSYTLKIKILLKQRGIFAFFIPDLISAGLRGKNCTNAGFTNILTNSNQNLNLFQYAMNRPPASQFEMDRIYCFRVQ